MKEARRWKRYIFSKKVVAKIHGAHLLPSIKIYLHDVGTGGFGFTSSWKLKEIEAELYLQSFPVFKGRIIYRTQHDENNEKVYRYGFEFSKEMTEMQLKKLSVL